MSGLFGTDGVRGVANRDLTCDIAFKLGQAAGALLGDTIVIGKDTRKSGDMLEASVAAGVMSAGGTALLAGVIPTPAVAYLTRTLQCAGGIVVSASHNPPEYNGIKFFDAQGYKLTDFNEHRIEDYVYTCARGGIEHPFLDTLSPHTPQNSYELPVGARVGTARYVDDACDQYCAHIIDAITKQGISFKGLHIALDVGHGASTHTSCRTFEELGAQVSVINTDYNGCDINVNCGSTHLEPLRALMKETGADIGVAHDGDADRVILLAPDGREIDGDIMLAVCALDLKTRHLLQENTVVSTVMCNLGFVDAMKAAGIRVVQTQVGDRHILEEMLLHGYNIGAEQSGHMILFDYNSTGDGLMSAAQFIAAFIRSGMPLDKLIDVVQKYPQVLLNVPVAHKENLAQSAEIQDVIHNVEQQLANEGRVLVRASGTEPLVRVMIEARDVARAQELANRIGDVVKRTLS